jgi:hypothetical protein
MYGLVLLEDAEDEPVGVDFVTKYERALPDDADIIKVLITAARQQAEAETNRAFVSQTYRLTLDDFPRSYLANPVGNTDVAAYGSTGYLPFDFGSNNVAASMATRLAIRIPKPPLLAITSIVYRDGSGSPVTLDPSAYVVDKDSLPGRIIPAVGTAWPATQAGPAAVTILFTAGLEDAEDVPADIQLAIALGVGTLFRIREGKVLGSTIVDNPIVKQLLARHRYETMD